METFAMHMHRLDDIGDVAISHRESTGELVFNNTTSNRVPMAKPDSLICFRRGGSGFIISLKSILINGALQMFALILTAGHVVYDIYKDKPDNEEVLCKLENGTIRVAYFIKTFVKESNQNFESALTGFEYCLPGDVALLLLELQPGDHVKNYDLSHDIINGAYCFVSGYPVMPRSPSYSVPQLSHETLTEIEKKANEIFLNFSSPVYSEGKIESHLNGLVEISCSTTNGMSGSPIVADGKVVGVYVGGPPLPGQRDVIKILQRISKKEDISSILSDIFSLSSNDHYYELEIFKEICDSDVFQKLTY